MIKIDKPLLDSISKEAQQTERKRKNYNFHKSGSDLLQRMINAMEPGTYVQPHKHESPDKREVFLILTGKMAVIEFDDTGKVTEFTILSREEGVHGIEIAPRIYHMVIALETGSSVYEIKDGPYSVADDKNFAPWAPREGNADCENYLLKIMTEIALV